MTTCLRSQLFLDNEKQWEARSLLLSASLGLVRGNRRICADLVLLRDQICAWQLRYYAPITKKLFQERLFEQHVNILLPFQKISIIFTKFWYKTLLHPPHLSHGHWRLPSDFNLNNSVVKMTLTYSGPSSLLFNSDFTLLSSNCSDTKGKFYSCEFRENLGSNKSLLSLDIEFKQTNFPKLEENIFCGRQSSDRIVYEFLKYSVWVTDSKNKISFSAF